MRIIKLLFAALLVIGCPNVLFAQAGTSSMSLSVGRAEMHRIGSRGQYIMPSPDMFRVEEFINYHRHDLPLPAAGKRVRLDVQSLRLENGKTVYQFGLTTPRAIDAEKMPPLNLVLVVDRSGSMSGAKIENLKKSIRAMIERFRKSDRISIVSFSNDARVDLESCGKTKISKIAKAIDCLEVGGGTNLHAGLMLGYQTAAKHFDSERTNRVIFLTDGNANHGVVDPSEITQQSASCNREGISLTTIGLGQDFNHDLLRQLADAGRGLAHFISDAKDIEKTFVSEIDSVLTPAANKVRLSIEFGNGTYRHSDSQVKFFGYQPQRKGADGNEYVFDLDDLNHGATQVVMAKTPKWDRCRGMATLKYTDAISGFQVTQSVDLSELDENELFAETGNKSIRRNYAIALVAEGIHRAARASNDGQCSKAEKRLRKAIEKSDNQWRFGKDEHIQRVTEIANVYLCKMNESLDPNRD